MAVPQSYNKPTTSPNILQPQNNAGIPTAPSGVQMAGNQPWSLGNAHWNQNTAPDTGDWTGFVQQPFDYQKQATWDYYNQPQGGRAGVQESGGGSGGGGGGSSSGGSDINSILQDLLNQQQNADPFRPDEGAYATDPGEREILLDRMLRTWLGLPPVEGQEQLQGNPALDLAASITRGELPDVQRQAFNDQLRQNMAEVTERFGQQGARWGTDLATRLGRETAEANTRLRSGIIDRSNQYLQQAMGAQQGLVGIEAQRSEAGIQRLFQEFLANQNNPLISQLLPSLLGAAR